MKAMSRRRCGSSGHSRSSTKAIVLRGADDVASSDRTPLTLNIPLPQGAKPMTGHLHCLKHSAAAGMMLALGVILGWALPARAESVADFYKGRTVYVVVGNSVGGGYDLNGRLLAKYMG